MFPGRDGTLSVLRHTVTRFRVGCAQDPGQNSARSQVKTQVKSGLLKTGSRCDQGSGAWAPAALRHSPAVCPGVTLPLWCFTLSVPGRQVMPETPCVEGHTGSRSFSPPEPCPLPQSLDMLSSGAWEVPPWSFDCVGQQNEVKAKWASLEASPLPLQEHLQASHWSQEERRDRKAWSSCVSHS